MLRAFVKDKLTPEIRAELAAAPAGGRPLTLLLAAADVTIGALLCGAVGLAPLTLTRETLTREADLRAKFVIHLDRARHAVREWNRGSIKTSVYWCGRGALGIFPIRCEAPVDETCRSAMEDHRQALRAIADDLRPAHSTLFFATPNECDTAIGVAPVYMTQAPSASNETAPEFTTLAHVLGLAHNVNVDAIVTRDLVQA